MKKKFLVIATLLTIVMSVEACGSADKSDVKVIESTTTNAEKQTTAVAEDSQYTLTYKDMVIAVDQDAAPIVEALGEPSSYFESPSCAGEGIGKLYTYSDIEIQTYPDGDKDLILYVLLRNDTVSTAEGLNLSSSKEDIISALGQPTSETSGNLVYEKGGMSLKFLFNGDDMISLEYDSAKN